MSDLSTTDFLIIGSYTSSGNPGIQIASFSPETNQLEVVDTVDVTDASYGVLSDDKAFFYAVNESGKTADTVTALKREGNSFSVLNAESSGGSAPCYITVNKARDHVFVANYINGSFSTIAINNDGSFSDQIQTIVNVGSGPDARQEGAHTHAVVLSPDEKYLLTADLGIDQVDVYTYSPKLTDAPLSLFASTKLPLATGPRHIIFSADGRFVYVIGEFLADIHVFSWNHGQLTDIQVINMTPDQSHEFHSAADIHFSPDGRYLYASNRGTVNQISIFSVDIATGLLTYVGAQNTSGNGPRNFVIHPGGKHLLVAHQYSNDVRIFGIDPESGLLSETDIVIDIPNPVFLTFF